MWFCLGSLALAVFGAAMNPVLVLSAGSGRCFHWAASHMAAESVLGTSRHSQFEIGLQNQLSVCFHSYFRRLG